MKELTLDELYEVYLDTIGRCTSDIRNRSDQEVEYDLFEQFDSGAWAFLHEDSLANLRNAGFIDDEMVAVSKEVRARWLALQEHSWTIAEIKSKKEWHELFELCDRLKIKALSFSQSPSGGRAAG